MLQMISMKNKAAFAFQQKTWGLALDEWQNSTWLLMLPLAGSGSGSSWELLCFVPIQPDAEVGEGFWVFFFKWVSKSARVRNGFSVKGLSGFKIIARVWGFKGLCVFVWFLKPKKRRKRRLLLLRVLNTSFTKLHVLRKQSWANH